MANHNIDMLKELIGHLHNLPSPSFDNILKVIESDEILKLPENERLPLWDELTQFISKHRRFANAKWALSEDLLSLLEQVSYKIAPTNPLNRYQYLFSGRDFDLYENTDNLEEQKKKLEERRQKVLKKLLDLGTVDTIIEFVDMVQSPNQLGAVLGRVADETIDTTLLPLQLDTEKNKISAFIRSYIWSRHFLAGWSWTDNLDRSNWTIEEECSFLCALPFSRETWIRVDDWLSDSQTCYWLKTSANPYETKGDLNIAIEKLLEHGRPLAAVDCLSRMQQASESIDIGPCVKALLATSLSPEPFTSQAAHNIVNLIEMLQGSPDIDADDLFRVEWAYLPLLELHKKGTPKGLEKRLSSDPDFFCEVIRLIYRSKKGDSTKTELFGWKKSLATRAWRLLYEWQTPPGQQDTEGFNEKSFLTWLQYVEEKCTETGHLEVALTHVGGVLIHCPADSTGLWINRAVANVLNGIDAEKMRDGFSSGLFNLRGVHVIDPSGAPERKIAEQYRQKAEDVENAGFYRLAVSLKALSESYDRQAEQIVLEHGKGKEESGE